jgi:hypothetical protein
MSDIVKLPTIEVIVTKNGDDISLSFHADISAFNNYINDIAASKDKIRPSFNHLMRTVVDGDKERLKEFILVGDNTPNGMAVMNIMGVLSEEMSGDIEFKVKKPNR